MRYKIQKWGTKYRNVVKNVETLCFLVADVENVGQEDPTVWIGYMCMIAISFFHSRITFCRNFFFWNSFLPGSFWRNLSPRKWPIVIWAARGRKLKSLHLSPQTASSNILTNTASKFMGHQQDSYHYIFNKLFQIYQHKFHWHESFWLILDRMSRRREVKAKDPLHVLQRSNLHHLAFWTATIPPSAHPSNS